MRPGPGSYSVHELADSDVVVVEAAPVRVTSSASVSPPHAARVSMASVVATAVASFLNVISTSYVKPCLRTEFTQVKVGDPRGKHSERHSPYPRRAVDADDDEAVKTQKADTTAWPSNSTSTTRLTLPEPRPTATALRWPIWSTRRSSSSPHDLQRRPRPLESAREGQPSTLETRDRFPSFPPRRNPLRPESEGSFRRPTGP